MNRFLGIHFILLLVAYFASSPDEAVSAEKRKDAFLKTYCLKCHDAEKHKGDVRLDQLAVRSQNNTAATRFVQRILGCLLGYWRNSSKLQVVCK